jgi:RNA polymerase sigma factor for flagellar operon FliA
MVQYNTARKNAYFNQGIEGCAVQNDKDRAVLEHIKLVNCIALRLISRLPDNIAVDDLISTGLLGLIDAMGKYDSKQGIPFQNYAKIRVKGAMLDEIRSTDWVPRSLRQKRGKLEKACVALDQRLGRDPTEEEIAYEMQISIEKFHKLLDETKGISFLFENIHEVILGNRESHLLASGSDELFDNTYRHEIRRHLAKAIGGLAEKTRSVISLYYYKELTMKEIGITLGCTESRISQIHRKALIKLKTRLAKKLRPDDLPGIQFLGRTSGA